MKLPMTLRRDPDSVRPGQGGFTMIELVVALAVTTIVMLGILFLFDFNNKLTRVQSNITDMQQSLRIAQYDMVRMVRMAGRGGLNADQGIFIAPNVGDNAHIIPTDANSPKVLPGTDILTVRGVFSTPILQVSIATAGSLGLTGGTATPNTATGGYVEICNLSPAGQVQDLSVLTGRLAHPEALVLVSPVDDQFYATVELDPVTSSDTETDSCPTVGPSPGGIRVGFKINSPYSSLSAPDPLTRLVFQKVAYVGLLEEYRFYVREGDTDSGLTPVLSRARFYPNTQTVYGGAEDLRQDIADGIMDLQVALGFDRNADGDVVENFETPEGDDDEWLGNSDEDTGFGGGLKALRITTLARTNRADNQYEAPVIETIEDHRYPLDTTDPVNSTNARKYRRRILQTVVNVRNLTI